MGKLFRLLGLVAVISLANLGIVSAWPQSPTSTCWLTCFSRTTGQTKYKIFNVTENACCSGSALSCPAGSIPLNLAWGEPAMLCLQNVS